MPKLNACLSCIERRQLARSAAASEAFDWELGRKLIYQGFEACFGIFFRTRSILHKVGQGARYSTMRTRDTQENKQRLRKRQILQRQQRRLLPFIQGPLLFCYKKQLMHSKASLAIMLIAMLLAQSLHGLKWQAMGSGMNNTVIAKIWDGLETKLETVRTTYDIAAKNNFVNDISDRLNTQWSPAWNVIHSFASSVYDTILYGYAFRNQWMWYNGVPYASQTSIMVATLIVWKDYNCQNWRNIADGNPGEQSSFSTAQKAAIRAEIDKMTEAGITNDIWGTAYTMMKNLEENPLFSSGGYSVIMAQDGQTYYYGRVCMVGNGFYYSYTSLTNSPIIGGKGNFYLFQTR